MTINKIMSGVALTLSLNGRLNTTTVTLLEDELKEELESVTYSYRT